MRLALQFDDSTTAQLAQVVFTPSSGESRISYRRKAVMSNADVGSFQWTAAVRAFAVLAVGTRLKIARKEKEQFMLAGEAKSLAASLDYAISKPTEWIVDLFGRDSSKRTLASKIFRRENTERKLPGPVKIALSNTLQEDGALKIFLGERELVSEADLDKLYRLINTSARTLSASEDMRWYQSSWFSDLLHKELELGLRETELLQPFELDRLLSLRLLSDKTKQSLTKEISDLKESLKKLQSAATEPNEQFLSKLQKRERPIVAACVPMAFTPIVTLHFLKQELGIPVELDLGYPSTAAILEALQGKSQIDLLLLSWSAALRRQNIETAIEYKSVMILPRTSLDLVIAPEFSKETKIEKVMMATENESYPMLYLQSLQEENQCLSSKVQTIDASLAEIMTQFPKVGERNTCAAILGFPFSSILAKTQGLKILNSGNARSRVGENLLFASAKSEFDSVEFTQLLRHAWQRLLEEKSTREKLIESLLSDEQFGKYLKRVGDLYKLHTFQS